MRTLWTLVASTSLLLAGANPVTARKDRNAEEIFADAKVSAADQHKLIFLEFSASWCGPCHELANFLSAPEIAQIIQRYFVFAEIKIQEEHGKHPELNTPGGEQLLRSLGGGDGVPFFYFLDANGATIVTSDRPLSGKKGGTNIGYPATKEEIDWFLTMLRKSLPSMSATELQTVETWLRRASPKSSR